MDSAKDEVKLLWRNEPNSTLWCCIEVCSCLILLNEAPIFVGK